MSSRRSERLVNLVIALLVTDRPLTRAELREAIEDYRGKSDQSFERTFERDKDELRNQGIDVRAVTIDSYFGNEVGYRIPRSDFELPPVQFSQAEADALGMAARVWRDQVLDESSASALTKLRAAGVEPDIEAGVSTQVTSGPDQTGFPELWRATLSGTPVRFDYRETAVRHVEPWRMVLRRGHWYLLGFDRDRQDPRVFRLSRISSKVSEDGPAGSVLRPGPEVVQQHLQRLEPPPASPVTALVAHDRTVRLPGRAEAAQPPESLPDQVQIPGDFVVETLTVAGMDQMVTSLLQAGGRAILLGPPQVRRAMADRLEQIAVRPWSHSPEVPR